MKKILALALALILSLSLLSACGGQPDNTPNTSDPGPTGDTGTAETPDPGTTEDVVTPAGSLLEIAIGDLDLANAFRTEMTVLVDGSELKVTSYEDCYVTNPTNFVNKDNLPKADQLVSIYIPEGADKNSPILFCVNNSGWSVNSYSTRTMVVEGKKFAGSSDADQVGYALSHGYVVVSYGARSREDDSPDGAYLTHTPATITDTKAVIRYLRLNADKLPAGDVEKIVITGTSGGGALSAIVASSGNSEDFLPYLYEIGAAGVEKSGDGYVSTLGDDVFATIAYCPINDLRMADAAYEFTYNAVRHRILAEGVICRDSSGTPFQFALPEDYTYEDLMAASDALAKEYGAYVDSLGLLKADGQPLTGENLLDEVKALLMDEIAETIAEGGAEKIAADLSTPLRGKSSEYLLGAEGWKDWVVVKEDGSFDFDYDEYLYWLARNSALKLSPAFSNEGLSSTGKGLSSQNEDSLYGTAEQAYCPFNAWSWANDRMAGNGVGIDDTGMTYEEYLNSEAGAQLALQLQMSSPIPYLTGDNGDSAPHWYVRHGMADRDTSFALQTVLYHAILNDESVKNLNFSFDWLYTHMGAYDSLESFAWLESVLSE